MKDNPERLTTEASFAALCGVSPIEYSTGRRTSPSPSRPQRRRPARWRAGLGPGRTSRCAPGACARPGWCRSGGSAGRSRS
nr:transposase [Streptomyces sp. MMG1121]